MKFCFCQLVGQLTGASPAPAALLQVEVDGQLKEKDIEAALGGWTSPRPWKYLEVFGGREITQLIAH